MKIISIALTGALVCAPLAGAVTSVSAQAQQQPGARAQSDASPAQRLEILRSRLEGQRRSLDSAVAGIDTQGGEGEAAKSAEEARTRLRGLEREVRQVLSDVANLRSKQERAERYDQDDIAKLESAGEDLGRRVEDGLRGTAGARRTSTTATAKPKKKEGLFGRLNPFGGGDEEDKYAELINGVAPGRDRQLFEEAAKLTRKSNYEQGRLLFQNIVLTYTDSPFLPLAKLAAADTFYLEGTTSALIQANASYKEWLAYFPTHPLADDVMLKMAETEMRQMGLPNRQQTNARKAEHQLKTLLQQFPDTSLKNEVATRLKEVQENLATHNLQVASFYLARYEQGKAANPKGGQSRLREVVEKYPGFSYMDEVLYGLGLTYVAEEEPDEAAKYFSRLLREHPNSRFAEKAGEQLDLIGVARPQPDPEALNRPEPVRPGITARLLTEITGSVPATVSKDGVIISKRKDGKDIIDEAIARGGELDPTRTPTAPVIRRPPARQVVPAATPAVPTTRTTSSAGGVAIRPTQPGAPPGASNIPTQKEVPVGTNGNPGTTPSTLPTTNGTTPTTDVTATPPA